MMQSAKSADEMLRFLRKKINTLEYQLSKIEMYFTNPPFNSRNETHDVTQVQSEIVNATQTNINSLSNTSTINTAYTQTTEYLNEGIIRITCMPFPYFQYSGGYASQNQLGNITTYVVRIYSYSMLNSFIKANKTFMKLVGEKGMVSVMIEGEKRGRVIISEARQLLKPDFHQTVIDLFNKGGGLTLYISNPIPPYIDVPLPIGKFFLAYSLIFDNSRNPDHNLVHPNYPNKPSDLSTIRWGLSSININSNQIANINFAPTNNINFYNYNRKQDWENSRAFWDYVDFLNWSGEVY